MIKNTILKKNNYFKIYNHKNKNYCNLMIKFKIKNKKTSN